LTAWSCETSGRFDLHLLPGGHFFLQDSRRLLLAIIGRQLALLEARQSGSQPGHQMHSER
jgi:surfactin synthase thioesterase subunit